MKTEPPHLLENAIAVVGMACEYPDANSTEALWENVLAQRRSFRRLPPERLRIENFLSEDRDAEDSTYATQAAVIANYEFDRDRFRIAESTYRSTDLAHWLALDVATRALADAGFGEGDGLPRETTGVILGNTLTGEFSRANALRLRWHFVRAAAEQAWAETGLPEAAREKFLSRCETQFKAPFPAVDADTLAGGLANTIAGRICNYYDLKGGGYTVDGACASSLLAVANACSALRAGDLDVALAGGVDLSLDPFELIGFAKVGALATDDMRVFDVRSSGFWPGEGCGFLVLMPYREALAQHRRIYATIRGWGISSDGKGGLTRPEFDGQVLSLRRAYRRAGFGADTVRYFEGHGTGTTVGDTTELRALSGARREAACGGRPAVIGSIKANIGHTKAAAGVAGLIKAIMAVHTGVVPPTTGCAEPHEELQAPDAPLQIAREAQPWPDKGPRRAAASAMGFGGINSHIVIEGVGGTGRGAVNSRARQLAASQQDAELFLFEAASAGDMRAQVERLSAFAPRLSLGELADLAAALEKDLDGRGVRAAIVASTAAQLADRLEVLGSWLRDGVTARLDIGVQTFLGEPRGEARIGFLFPGQAAPVYRDGGLFARRFETVRNLYAGARLPVARHAHATAVAQPAIVTASAAGLRILAELGIEARVAVGHSLGEISALHWAGAIDEDTLLKIATARGQAMTDIDGPEGAMGAIEADAEEVSDLLEGDEVRVVGLNSPRQTVISGETGGVRSVLKRARLLGFRASELPVAHAFHTPLVAAATPVLAGALAQHRFAFLQRRLISTVIGEAFAPDENFEEILCRQMTAPVRFLEALRTAAEEVDLLIEVGPGQVLTGLVGDSVAVPAIALDAGGSSLRGLLAAVGAAFVLSETVNHRALFAGRVVRPFSLDWRPTFFANPCESVVPGQRRPSPAVKVRPVPQPMRVETPANADARSVFREVVAQQMKLPVAAIKDDNRMLSDLHLNSITVGQLVSEAARRAGAGKLVDVTRFANATVGQIAEALEEFKGAGPVPSLGDTTPAGLEPWIEPFRVALVERARAERKLDGPSGEWTVLAPAGHPLKTALERGLRGRSRGVVVCLPAGTREEFIPALLQGARTVMALGGQARFILVQPGATAAAFAKTLHRETPGLTTCVVSVPQDHPQAAEWIIAETLSGIGYTEAHYDADGTRREPELQWLPLPDGAGNLPLGANDVILVTGGGKGITAECALELARRTGAALAILGRSKLEGDPELRRNLKRIADAGARVRYVETDVADAEAVRQAVAEVERALGPISGIVHGAGRNVPRSLAMLDEAAFTKTLAPKVRGAEHVLAAVNAENLRLFVTFGSIIARIGMAGEADYGLANAWLASLTERFQQEHPRCQCLCLEWSVWSSLGMGEKLGRIETLLQHGVTAIPPEVGARIFCDLIAARPTSVSIVVTGRFGHPPTLRMDQAPLPAGRFLERPRVQYPVEWVCDTPLSAASDPYVNEHMLQGQRLFPAVMAMEAMAQVAMALARSSTPPVFENLQLQRPVVVPDSGETTIRIQGLLRARDRVELALLCEDTGFAVQHFAATCRFASPGILQQTATEIPPKEAVPLNPARDLYDTLLFHTGRFRRVAGYRRLTATECIAELSCDEVDTWFGAGLSQMLALGDAAGRDAAIHAIQACIPHRRVLPIRVARLTVVPASTPGARFVWAKERSRTDDEFTYDVLVRDAAGEIVESWEGLCLRAVENLAPREPWPEALLSPYLERRLGESLPGTALRVGLLLSADERREERTAKALQRALGSDRPLSRRPDGKPEMPGTEHPHVSSAHAGQLTLVVAGAQRLGCDLELVTPRSAAEWADLLTVEQHRLAELIVAEVGEDFGIAALRVWTAAECLKKAGLTGGPSGSLTFGEAAGNGWLILHAPSAQIGTWLTRAQSERSPLVLSFLAENPRGLGQGRSEREAAIPARVFEYHHIVTFEETNVVGNVYFVNHLSWQGRCREMFLREKAPGAIKELDAKGLSLATSNVACEYFEELFPFDEVLVRMSLRELTPGSAALVFDYLRRKEATITLIARGQQTVAVKTKAGAEGKPAPAVFPDDLYRALGEYLSA